MKIRNITHIKGRLPWPHYRPFGVGDVMIESARSQASEITLRTIRRPGQAYDGVAALMRANGFQIERRKLLHQEGPDTIATVLKCGGMIAAAAPSRGTGRLGAVRYGVNEYVSDFPSVAKFSARWAGRRVHVARDASYTVASTDWPGLRPRTRRFL